MFTATHYEFSVSENVPSGVITGDTIDTTDADVTEDNKMVTYSFTNQRLVDWFDITDDVSRLLLVTAVYMQWNLY